ncbi:MAG: DNA gyrase/topoisomerase IV subunit A [Bacteroidales bacterium]|nr:DNA gyrase/topoisomerase IV subunit A [Bacteroidales bacterium]
MANKKGEDKPIKEEGMQPDPKETDLPGEDVENPDQDPDESQDVKSSEYQTIQLSGMYENWFLDYASYVILERAVPNVFDGLKPVQRRILHAMKDMDDGRFNKVANIIGHTMKYHPHGDASIGDALVQLGQKDLLIETQGNWGNILTGDSAAAPRYIEARLSKFALDVVFNPKTTNWKISYDGRNKEPVTQPVKFPLLLTQGVEGIAVGLASKILPHNFNELIDASISILKNKSYQLLPDFPTGGLADFSRYNEGLRGGRVRVRARINQIDKKTLSITEVPFGTTTVSLIETILAANDKGKIKIKKIDDNTAEHVEILIYLTSGVSPDQTIDALYAFTNCEMSISPNSCVIDDDKPRFLPVKEILDISTQNTVELLRSELLIRKGELEMQWHFSSLEKIFIEERIYRKIENCKTWESVITTIDKGLDPFKERFKREVDRDDIIRLTEIKIKRISRHNSLKADEVIKAIEEEMEEVLNHLEHLIDYSINYFRQIKKKFGKGRERKTEIRNFDTIQATAVVAVNQKLYLDREEGFAGTSLRKHEYICDCSDIDDVIVFRADGNFFVTKMTSKTFVGKEVVHIGVFKRGDDRTIYNMVYRDGKQGKYMVKRFPVMGITRDKEYSLTRGTAGSKVHYFSANPNGEAEVIRIVLRPNKKLKISSLEYDFSTLAIKGRGSYGNILSRRPVKSIVKKEEGVSTLGARDIWFDDTVKRLNVAERGTCLGAFIGDDKILTISKSGNYRHYNFDLSNHFDEDMVFIEKFDPRKIMTAVFWNAAQGFMYIKRFHFDESYKKTIFIGEHPDSKLLAYSLDYLPVLEVKFDEKANGKPIDDLKLEAADFIGIKSYKAKGKRLTAHAVKRIEFLDPLPYEPPQDETAEAIDTAKTAEPEAPAKNAEVKKSRKPGKKTKIAEDPESDSEDDGQTKLDL